MQIVYALWQQKRIHVPIKIAFILETNEIAEEENIKVIKIGIGPANRATSK